MKRRLKSNLSAMLLVSATTLPFMALAIDTPLDVGIAEMGGDRILWKWGAVEGAVKYEVTVDGAYAGETQELQWESLGMWVGDHSMTVKAVSAAGEYSEQSQNTKTYLFANMELVYSEDVYIAPPPHQNNPEPSVPEPGSNVSDNQTPVNETPVGDTTTGDTSSSPPPGSAAFLGNAPEVSDSKFIDPQSYGYPEVTQKPGYELVFSDEFNGNSINPDRWHTQLRWDGEWNGERYEYRVINGEDQFYVSTLSPDEEHQQQIASVANPFEFGEGRLAIRATVNPLKKYNTEKAWGKLLDIAQQQTFLSGVISTHDKFYRKYGYFEARIKIPSHVGTFPAFWLFHDQRAWEGTQRTEIDIMENLGHAPMYVYNSFHYFKNVSEYYGGDHYSIKPSPNGQIYTGIDYSADYHVYAVKWEPGKVTYFIDGEKTSEVVSSESDYEELYLAINLAMGGNWTNFGTNAGGLGRAGNQHFPNAQDIANFGNPALEIDYVRVYKPR